MDEEFYEHVASAYINTSDTYKGGCDSCVEHVKKKFPFASTNEIVSAWKAIDAFANIKGV